MHASTFSLSLSIKNASIPISKILDFINDNTMCMLYRSEQKIDEFAAIGQDNAGMYIWTLSNKKWTKNKFEDKQHIIEEARSFSCMGSVFFKFFMNCSDKILKIITIKKEHKEICIRNLFEEHLEEAKRKDVSFFRCKGWNFKIKHEHNDVAVDILLFRKTKADIERNKYFNFKINSFKKEFKLFFNNLEDIESLENIKISLQSKDNFTKSIFV